MRYRLRRGGKLRKSDRALIILFSTPLACVEIIAKLFGLRSIISSIDDGHLNVRYCSRFESPLSKRIGSDLIEKRIADAFHHCCAGNIAVRGIDSHNANAAASNMGTPRFVRIIGKRGANCEIFAATNDVGVAGGALGCTIACLLTRGLFSSTVAAGVASSSGGGVCWTIGPCFLFDVAAKISRLGFDLGFSSLSVGVPSALP